MPSPEQRSGPNSEQEKPKYSQAARFADEKRAGRAYRKLENFIFMDPRNDLSVYRFLLRSSDTPQSPYVSHVAVIGEPPHEELEKKLQAVLSAGVPVSLPEDILKALQARRTEAKKLGPWVERHYRRGMQR